MKKNSGLLLVFMAFVLAVSFTSAAMAVPPFVPGPNDNQLICHNTQHHQLEGGNANANQKGVVINVDPSSIAKNPHIKHGDACIAPINTDPRAVAACNETEPFGSVADCTGECDLSATTFPGLDCCSELSDPTSELSCLDPGVGDPQGCEDTCFGEGGVGP